MWNSQFKARIIRESRESGDDPAERIVNEIGGWVLFRGEVVSRTWENREGYMWGETVIKGNGIKPGNMMKVWYKNENHVTWLDDKPWITSPDIIEIIDSKSGEPITNTDIKKGDPIYRTSVGLKVLGQRHFGFDLNYSPIEKLV